MVLLAFGLLSVAFLLLAGGAVLLLVPLLRGAPFYPSSERAVTTMRILADVRTGERVVDLGSGDGRLVVAFAQAGAETHGYEINPVLVWVARRSIRRLRLEKKAFVHTGDFWNKDFSGFDVVSVYGIPRIMAPLQKKLRRELRAGARVVSNVFPFPNWEPLRREGKVYLYRQDRPPALPTSAFRQ